MTVAFNGVDPVVDFGIVLKCKSIHPILSWFFNYVGNFNLPAQANAKIH